LERRDTCALHKRVEATDKFPTILLYCSKSYHTYHYFYDSQNNDGHTIFTPTTEACEIKAWCWRDRKRELTDGRLGRRRMGASSPPWTMAATAREEDCGALFFFSSSSWYEGILPFPFFLPHSLDIPLEKKKIFVNSLTMPKAPSPIFSRRRNLCLASSGGNGDVIAFVVLEKCMMEARPRLNASGNGVSSSTSSSSSSTSWSSLSSWRSERLWWWWRKGE